MNNNNLKKLTIIGITTTLLSGCATREEVLTRYKNNCYDYGFVYGTDAFAKCMVEQEKMMLKQDRHYNKLNRAYVAPVIPYYAPTPSYRAKSAISHTHIHNNAAVNNRMSSYKTAALKSDLEQIERDSQKRRAKADAKFQRRTAELRHQNEENLHKIRELSAKEEADNKKRLQIEKDAALATRLQAEEFAKEQKLLENERKAQAKAEELRLANEKRLQEVEAQAKTDKEIHDRQIEQMAINRSARSAMHDELKAKVAEREARLNGTTNSSD